MNTRTQIESLLARPNDLLLKEPFTRGAVPFDGTTERTQKIGQKFEAKIPKYDRMVISQNEYLRELDPDCHKVLFDSNLPTITMRLQEGGYGVVEYKRMALPFQRNILDKQVLHLCGNPIMHNMMASQPTERQKENFVTFKQYWDNRNQDGMKTKMVRAQKSMGEAGLLYYMDRYNQIKCRLISYDKGYTIISHNDDNGDRLMECVYYHSGEMDYLDCYDDTYMTRFHRGGDEVATDDSGWVREYTVAHGFQEIPLVTKRGKVAWEDVQSIIEVYEVIYNVFITIQKKHGWGLLYIKGKFAEKGQKLAGSIILNDTSLEGNGKAEYLKAPEPGNMIETLGLMEESIQKGSGTTFLLPKDVKVSGDISGVAIMLTQSMDIETALAGVIEWQNVADKMTRLFKFGLAKELVMKGINETAITDFNGLDISAKFQIWRPKSESELVTNLSALRAANLISRQTGIEQSPFSQPDEVMRCANEDEEEAKKAAELSTVTAVVEEGVEIEDKIDNKLK